MMHRPRKRFGQNFLQDRAIIEEILRAIGPQARDNMLEIGPGLGALTQPLLGQLDALKAVEIDRDLLTSLEKLPGAQDKLQLICADALKVDYSQFGHNLRIVGNLPYNISAPLLIYLLGFASFIEDMYFMLQKEVAYRVVAKPGTRAYGRFSVMIQYHCEVECLLDVVPEAFYPIPKVDSALVRLTPFSLSPFEEVAIDKLASLLAKAFAMPRKTLMNNLRGVISSEQMAALGIDSSKRPEQISIEEYIKLTSVSDKQK